jgi:hypothetical protein
VTHADIVKAIEARGGRVVASLVLDETGQTEGAPREYNSKIRCSVCGERGHSRKRCDGPGQPLKPTYEERRRGL